MSTGVPPGGRGRGRPRSDAVRRAVLLAARDLIAESGYEQLTVQAVAARAGSSRQTLYRWWTSKALIVAELVIEGELALPALMVPDTGHLEHDLVACIDAASATFADPQVGPVLVALVTAAADSPAEASRLYDSTTGPYHRALVERLVRGVRAQQIGPAGDPTAIADAVVGVVLFRALTPGARPAPTPALVRTLLG